jgi:hypothetical protein
MGFTIPGHLGRHVGVGQRGVVDALDGELAEVRLEDLAHRGLGQLGQDLDVLGDRRALRDVGPRVLEEFGRGGRGALDELDIGAGHLARMGVGLADGAGEGHGRVPDQRLLDLGGVDVVAAADDDVLGAARDPDVAVGVHPAQVAGARAFRRPVLARVEGSRRSLASSA